MAVRRRVQALEVAHPNAAGIDIGSASHFVAIPPDRDAEVVREFRSFTQDLEALAQWLEESGVDVVAMEATGVYWIPLYELLEGRGFSVHLVNARHVKNVSGRKSDVLECDQQLALVLGRLARHNVPALAPNRRGRPRNVARFDLRRALHCACGVDLTRVDGIDVATALKVIAEVGPELSRFKTSKHFCSWLGLCPGTKISGGKVLSGASKRTANRLAQALRLAATSLRTSQSALGAYYRRLCGRLDKPKAIRAAAHKLARLVYTLLTKGEQYIDQGQDYYEERHRQRVMHHLTRKASVMGYKLVAVDPIAE